MINVVLNNELNGVEIYFDIKPIKAIRESLRSAGYIWHGIKKCWYTKQTEKAMAEAQKYINSDVLEDKKVKRGETKMKLWELTTYTENQEVKEKNYNTKEIIKEIRSHLKARFKFVKFSITNPYSSKIYIEIKSSPFEKESTYLKAIINYCENFVNSFKFCTCYDPYGDYGSSYNFYSSICIDYDYIQTEATEDIKNDMKDFDIKKADAEKAEEERKKAEYQAYLIEQEAKEKAYLLRIAEEKKQAEYVNNNIEVVELAENENYFVMGAEFARLNKNSTLDQYKEEVKKGEFHVNNVKITREVHFKDNQSLEYYSNMLMNDFEFIAGTGGSNTDDKRINSMTDYINMSDEEQKTVEWYSMGIAVYFNDVLQFVIDSQGHNYARYVGLVNNITIKKSYEPEQIIADYVFEELKEKANIIIECSNKVIENKDIDNSFNKNDSWSYYKDQLKAELKSVGIKPTKAIIQQLPEEHEELKKAMYKILVEVDGIQEQFKNSGLVEGEKITIIQLSAMGGISTTNAIFKNAINTTYAQYDNVVKMVFRPSNKKKDYYNYFYDTMLLFKGWHEVPKKLLYEITEEKGFICTKTKYGSYDNAQYDIILNYFENMGIKPVINTYKPQF